jgi:LacI family repressor for deo operon, udp, cdd, tsx, nupC, and nupG
VATASIALFQDGRDAKTKYRRVSVATQERVVNTARRLGYRPNRLVRSLRTGRTQTVALILPSFSGMYFARIATGVQAEAKKHGYHVLLSQVVAGLEDEVGEIEVLLERRVDGLIIGPRYGQSNRDKYRQLLQGRFPLVLVGDDFEDVPASAVCGDDFHGMYQATEHLIRLGHRRIAHLAGAPEPPASQARVAGYRAAMRDHGLEVAEADVQWYGGPEKDPYHNMQRLLARPDRLTAVTAVNDQAALDGIRAALEAGRRVPQEVAVVGYGDYLENPWMHKIPLTSMAVDTEEMGRRAMALLIGEMREPGGQKTVEKLPAKLIVRESCGAKRS